VTRRIIATAVGLVLAAVLLAALLVTLRFRSERNAARNQVAQLEGHLESSHQTQDALQSKVESTSELTDDLHAQIEWDKSHLLDCWTAIVGILPVKSMPKAVRGSIGAARSGESLDHYVMNCATDAVP